VSASLSGLGLDSTSRASRIAVVGDLHSAWDDADVEYFNRTRYALLLFTGDLGGSGARDGMRIAKSLARLTRPALVMPGNNDVEQYARIAAELAYRKGRAGLIGNLRSEPPPAPDAGTAQTCGYSLHRFEHLGVDLTVVAGRPFAMGGSELSFAGALDDSFGVKTMADSAKRLKELVDQVESRDVVFLSHNGPSGLGSGAESLWGSDFSRDHRDWGDVDLAAAVTHAKARGLRIHAVVAGHMHWTLKSGGLREWRLERDGTLYLNPARVPRIEALTTGKRRYHVALTLSTGSPVAEEIAVVD
jgi:uncharacterized protein (TIGR04168 family)